MPIMGFAKGLDFRDKKCIMAVCAHLQLDTLCRIGNIIGQYPLQISSLVYENQSVFEFEFLFHSFAKSKQKLNIESKYDEIF